MKTLAFMLLIAASQISGCASKELTNAGSPVNTNSATGSVPVKPIRQVPLTTVSKYPAVGLKEYVLVTDDLDRDKAEAEAVIQTKIELPYAMQTKLKQDFEPVLGRNFSFRAIDELYDRDGYINNRVGDPAKVKRADYRNVVVQFIGDRALVTYSNIVEDQPGGPGAWKADMTWADVLVKEDGHWKYEVIHLIEFKDLTTPKK